MDGDGRDGLGRASVVMRFAEHISAVRRLKRTVKGRCEVPPGANAGSRVDAVPLVHPRISLEMRNLRDEMSRSSLR